MKTETSLSVTVIIEPEPEPTPRSIMLGERGKKLIITGEVGEMKRAELVGDLTPKELLEAAEMAIAEYESVGWRP